MPAGYPVRIHPNPGPLPTAADFYETHYGLVLRLETGRVKPTAFLLSLAGQELLVKGRRQPPPPEGTALHPPGDGLRRLRALHCPPHTH